MASSQGLICTKKSAFGTQQSGLYRGGVLTSGVPFKKGIHNEVFTLAPVQIDFPRTNTILTVTKD